jgi:hypothetical protein
MVELRSRLSHDADRVVSGLVLQTSGKGDYLDTADGISLMLDNYDGDFVHDFVLVSPNDHALARFLADYLAGTQPAAMQGARIHFLGTPGELDRVRRAAAKSGATIVLIDRNVPVAGQALPEAVPDDFSDDDN